MAAFDVRKCSEKVHGVGAQKVAASATLALLKNVFIFYIFVFVFAKSVFLRRKAFFL